MRVELRIWKSEQHREPDHSIVADLEAVAMDDGWFVTNAGDDPEERVEGRSHVSLDDAIISWIRAVLDARGS
jgi:hypothetical protein